MQIGQRLSEKILFYFREEILIMSNKFSKNPNAKKYKTFSWNFYK